MQDTGKQVSQYQCILGIHETREVITHARNAAGASIAIVSLDFQMFNAYREEIV